MCSSGPHATRLIESGTTLYSRPYIRRPTRPSKGGVRSLALHTASRSRYPHHRPQQRRRRFALEGPRTQGDGESSTTREGTSPPRLAPPLSPPQPPGSTSLFPTPCSSSPFPPS